MRTSCRFSCVALVLVGLTISLPVFASYKKAIMEPWLGATRDELTAKWGYPQSADDLVKIDNDTVVFSYRSSVRRVECIVSFTLKNDVVIAWKYRGGNCLRIKRDKKVSAPPPPT